MFQARRNSPPWRADKNPGSISRLPASQRKNVEDVNVLMAEDYLLNQIFMQKLCSRMGVRKIDIVDAYFHE